MLIDYQSLVHDSTNTLFEFRDNSKSAIENVVTAIELFEEDEYLDALEILAENKTLADNMAAKSKLLADKSNKLCTMTGDALKNATNESNMTAEKKARLLNVPLLKFEIRTSDFIYCLRLRVVSVKIIYYHLAIV